MTEPARGTTLDILREGVAGKYADLVEIGRGGMAVVYRAHDLVHGRPVALKVLRPELGRALGPDRFLREIQIEARLQHPNILPLFDSGRVEEHLYYVMPYVDGGSLRDRLRREPQLPVEEAVAIAREVADALSHAHALGILHRDVKPENILFSGGHAVLADFGVARAILAAGGDKITETGVAIGTPLYMSPEQGSGETRLDGRCDIYALGCVLFEMLAGDPPFAGSTVHAILSRHASERLPSIEIVRPRIPGGVITAMERALEKVPADRFRSAADFRDALKRALDSPVGRPVRLNVARGIRMTVGLVAALAVGWVGYGLWGGNGGAVELDPVKAVVFPFREQSVPSGMRNPGYDAALAIVRGLEHSPLRPVDAWDRLDDADRVRPAGIPAATALRIARGRRAGRYVTGVVTGSGESLAVQVRLWDAAGDSLLAQRSSAAPAAEASVGALALDALRELLPALVDPERGTVDLSPLLDRKPAAVALWLVGEREYRSSRFADALAAFQQAIAEDSALVMAAVVGAQAASWLSRFDEATGLINVALRHESLLPEHYRMLAHGIAHYFQGRADSAVAWLRPLTEQRPDWAEGRMSLGEVLYHLDVSNPAADSMASLEFRAAWEGDNRFTPALMHLTEQVIRGGVIDSAATLLERYGAREPDGSLVAPLEMILRCVRSGGREPDWTAAARIDPPSVIRAGKQLGEGGAHVGCAEHAFRAVLANPVADERSRWGALVGLQGLLVATGRGAEAAGLLDSAARAGQSQALAYFIIGTLAGAPMAEGVQQLERLVSEVFLDDYRRIRGGRELWLLGVWYVHTGNQQRVRQILDALDEKVADESLAAEYRERYANLAHALRADVALASGDSARALALLREVRSIGRTSDLAWQYADPQPIERLRLAQLLLARGEWQEAMDAARVFDHPAPVVFWEFLPLSLAIRMEAARQIGDPDLLQRLQQRLALLDDIGKLASSR